MPQAERKAKRFERLMVRVQQQARMREALAVKPIARAIRNISNPSNEGLRLKGMRT